MCLESLCGYDRANAPNLAAAELLSRQVQMVEERHKDRALGSSSDAADSRDELHLFAGRATRSNLCTSPLLSAWIADQLRDEAAINKERRKAREARAHAFPKKGPKGGGGGGGEAS